MGFQFNSAKFQDGRLVIKWETRSTILIVNDVPDQLDISGVKGKGTTVTVSIPRE